MGVPHLFEEPILFIGTLFSEINIFEDVFPVLKDKFGTVLFQSDIQPWNYSAHYTRELGTPLQRNFIFFDGIIDPSTLADIKLLTNDIEAVYSIDGKRRINLDPGYITLAKVVLASTKNYSHRIYLGKGIYAELALLYRNHQFITLPYTYNDYKAPYYVNMFMNVREVIKRKQDRKIL